MYNILVHIKTLLCQYNILLYIKLKFDINIKYIHIYKYTYIWTRFQGVMELGRVS